jgi:hypothetical protein
MRRGKKKKLGRGKEKRALKNGREMSVLSA